MTKKITGDMGMVDLIVYMAEDNFGAADAAMGMLEYDRLGGFADLLLLDTLKIRGERLYTLSNDCCDRDQAKLKRTIRMIRSGAFTKKDVIANLDREDYALPFIDDDIKLDGVPPYGEDFGPTHPKWDEWCKTQAESFRRRSAED